MLIHLSIQNYVLIRNLEIDFQDGLSVITGETGAGKSILLGEGNPILGKRADTKVLLDKSNKCIVEGVFRIQDYGLENFFKKYDLDYENPSMLRREINKNGKSRAFINDTPVTLDKLRELSEKLIDIHSQDQTRTLSESAFQLALIDSYAGIQESVIKYRKLYNEYTNQRSELNDLIEIDNKNKSELDYFQFLFNELEEINLKENEQQKLESELEILKHAEEIKSKLFSSSQEMDSENGLLNIMTGIRNRLNQIAKYSDNLNDLSERIASAYIELSDIQNELDKTGNEVDHYPAKIDEINNRLDLIYQLEAKHRVNSVEELLQVKSNLSEKLQNFASLESKINTLKNKLQKMQNKIDAESRKISNDRIAVLPGIEKKVIETLESVGMQDARIKIERKEKDEPGKDGIDNIKYLFNANKGGEIQELARVASGGEKSRLMLALKSLISKKNLLPTVIFDEIDTGISGQIAGKVGTILAGLSTSMQVIAITHLPQIAGKGKSHFVVYKETESDTAITKIKELNQDERILEIAKMLSGQDVTNASYETAKHLLKN